MYAGFNLKDIKFESIEIQNKYYEIGENELNKNKESIQSSLKEYICDKDVLDGTLIAKDWFPQIQSNIFISHSHTDKKLAVSLAGFLHEEFEISSFIDSYIWGYVNDLLKELDYKYCPLKKDEKGVITAYNYDNRNITTSHVHMMLAMALLKMIDETECFFFLNTSKSISLSDSIKANTLSPWIYSELVISQRIGRKPKNVHRNDKQIIASKNFSEDIKIKYEAPLGQLIKLNSIDINNWSIKSKENNQLIKTEKKDTPLDILYKLKEVPEIIK